MKRVGRVRTTDTGSDETKDIVASSAGENLLDNRRALVV